MRRFAPRRRRQLGSLVRTFALRSAIVFVLVGVVLHFLVESLVEDQFLDQAEFHAEFVTDAVLTPKLQEIDLAGGSSRAELVELGETLRLYAVDLDDAVYHVVVWGPDGIVLASDDAAHLGVAADGYEQLAARARSTGLFSVDGPAPYLTGDPPVESTLRTFVPFEAGSAGALVAEVHQDWSPTLAASRTFSRTLEAGLIGGLVLLWALSLPIARRAGRRLHERSRTDELTELPNRAALEERLEAALERIDRTGACVALLFVDLDGFKRVNDTYGHATGDRALQEVAGRLLASTRAGDTVSRFAGDEFVVILENSDGVLAEQAARRLLDEVRRPLDELGSVGLSASIGMATTDDPDLDADMLLRHADAAMYQVKSDGGNSHCIFNDELRHRVARQNEIERELRVAVPRDEFHLNFQPFIVPTDDDAHVVAVEALLRWTHPRLGAVGPMEFIPLAERNGTIEDIGAWVLRETCQHLAAWELALAPDQRFVVYINLSAAQLNDRLLDVVDQAVRDSGVDPGRLGFEITETAVLEDGDESVTDLLLLLRQRGFHIALDDFGTGYSSLSRLRATPLDLLKLDRSFVNAAGDDGQQSAILTAVSGLAREMGIEVVAEGVETAVQLDAVARLGFDLAQGYHIARPAPPEQVRVWLESGAGAAVAAASRSV